MEFLFLDLEEVKLILRLEDEYIEEDSYLQLLMLNAEDYIWDAVDGLDELIENPGIRAKAKLIAYMLIVDWYEKRDTTGIVSDNLRYSFSSLMLQLQTYGR